MFKFFVKISSLFLIIALGAYLLQAVEPTQQAYTQFIDEHLKSHGIIGVLFYIGLSGVLVCFSVPRQLLSFIGGYAFGAVLGAIYATLATLLGCVLSFYYTRLIAQKFAQKHFGSKVEKMENFLAKNTLQMTIIIRLLPVGSNLVTNMLAGITKVKALPFFLGSFIGYIPQNFIFSLLGSGIQLETYTRILISALLLVIATLLGYYLYQKNKKNILEIE